MRSSALWMIVAAAVYGQEAAFQAALIFPPQSQHVHSSTIAECPNGDLIAAWFQGSGERSANDVRVMGARLKHNETSWSAPFLMADTPDIPDCNPVLWVDGANRLWLFWMVVHTNRWERAILKYRRSEDYQGGGPPVWSWQDIIILKPGESFQEDLRAGFDAINYPEPMWAEYAPQYTRMIVEAAADPLKRETGWMARTQPVSLPGGRILLPLYSDGFNVSLAALSDDMGETWRASKPIVGLGPIQPSIARRANGDLVAFCRDSGAEPGRVMASESKDDGETWSIAVDTDLPNPGSSVAALTLANGHWVIVLNDTEQGRHRLAVALSENEGRTWLYKRNLDADDAGEGSYSYPTAVQSRDGRIQVTYSHRDDSGAAIKHAAFEEAWIRGRNP